MHNTTFNMRVGRALCLFSLAHSLVRSSAVLVKPKGELLAQSLVQVLAEPVGEALSMHGSLKGEFLAHSLVQVQVQEEGWMKMQVQERRGVSS